MKRFQSLTDWLEWQQKLHPREIDLGLERVRAVAERMGVCQPGCPVITVAGTNGKGSTAALFESVLLAAGIRPGTYTSPHLLRYNERIRIGGAEVDDAALIDAFARIDQARGDISLSYFEFGTLAALYLFAQAECDAWILEVGLGGRLDAVNIVDADLAVITSIGLDHTDWLGPDLDAIGREKAGVFRSGRPAVYAQPDPPASVTAYAQELEVPLQLAGRDYCWSRAGTGWRFAGRTWQLDDLPPPALAGEQQIANAAAVVAGLEALQHRLSVSADALREGLRRVKLAGRFQIIPGEVEWILDVAHNRDSVQLLTRALGEHDGKGRTLAVFAQMQRKELDPLLEYLAPLMDNWYLLELPDADARPAAEIAEALKARGLGARLAGQGSVTELTKQIAQEAIAGDRVVVFGSFRTVEEVLRCRTQAG